jgi:AraC-like DNA-binding protein
LNIKTLTYGKYLCDENWYVYQDNINFHRIYYVLDDCETTYTDSKEKIELKKGFLYVFPINKAYEIKQNIERPLFCIYFHINIFPNISNGIISIDTNVHIYYKKIFELIEYIIDSQIDNMENMHKMMELFINYFALNQELNYIYDNKFSEVIEYINDNIDKKISNDTLAKLCGYQKEYFLRIFKKYFELTPQKYILNVKIDYAKRFLPSCTVKETAYELGYDNEKAFSRIFKKQTGLSPSLYDKSHYRQP